MGKLIIYDFRCENGHKFDGMVCSNVFEYTCPECGLQGKRLISTPRFDWQRMGLDKCGLPTMAAKWEKVHSGRQKVEKAHFEKHGTAMTPGADIAG
jgi:hypothetical protein